MAKTSEPVSLSSRSKSLAASSWTVLSSESASTLGTSTSKSVSSKMSFSPFLAAGRRRGRERRLGLRRFGRGRLAWRLAMRRDLLVGQGSQLDRVGLAQPQAGAGLQVDPRIAGPREVDPGKLGIGGRHVGVARLASGVDSNSSLASSALSSKSLPESG